MSRVLLAYTPRARTPNEEFVSRSQLDRMSLALQLVGHDTKVLEYHPSHVDAGIDGRSADLVFNLVYGWTDPELGISETQPESAARIEKTGVPCVGSESRVQVVAQDKLATAAQLATVGILSPRQLEPEDLEKAGALGVIKPRYGACHRGISIVHSEQEARDRLGPDIMLQEYVDGPEYTVGVLERNGDVEILPPVRVLFEDSDHPHVMAWGDHTFTFEIDKSAESLLAPLARDVFRAMTMRDYARIDLRVTHAGIVVFDVNSLPNLDPDFSLLSRAARAAGMEYEQLVSTICASALRRVAVAR